MRISTKICCGSTHPMTSGASFCQQYMGQEYARSKASPDHGLMCLTAMEPSNYTDHAKSEPHKAPMMCFVGAKPKA